MATANPLWGAPRIHGELRTLGIDVSERTVSRLLKRGARPPSQTWRTFLTNHIPSAASIDFFTVQPLTGRMLFVVVVLSHARRRILHANMVDAFPGDTAPCWIHRDRDRIYGVAFARRVAGFVFNVACRAVARSGCPPSRLCRYGAAAFACKHERRLGTRP
jgi:hypothetical protein